MLTVMVIGLVLIGHVPVGNAQKCTNVGGIISRDTTWTPSNNPYNFTEDVTVASGVTLTIEPGTEVSGFIGVSSWVSPDDSHLLEVNGTLHAEGTAQDPIEFGSINVGFGSSSASWNAQSSSGSIIQYTENEGFIGTYASPKIDNNKVLNIVVSGGSPVISNNVIATEMDIEAGSPVISNNTITAESGGYPTELPAVNFEGQNSALFYGNHVNGGLFASAGSPNVENNLIQYGGITVYGETNPVIENNTIAACSIGINIYDLSGSPAPTIAYNNFEQNSQYNIYLGQQGNYSSTAPSVDAADNWWGTTDLSVINQTIYDHKDNFNVGTVTFTPVLTSPNVEASPDPNAPTPTANPAQTTNPTSQPTTSQTQTPTATTQQPSIQSKVLFGLSWDEIAIVGLTVAVVVLVAATLFYRSRSARQAKQP